MKVKLGDICTINPKTPHLDDDLPVSFVPMQNVGEDGTIDVSETRLYRDVKKGFTFFSEGDVLFAKITPCMENGKGAIACGLMNGTGFGSTEFHVLRPDLKRVDKEWIYYFTTFPVFRKNCQENMTGSAGQKRVPKSFIQQYPLSLPTLAEQKTHITVLNQIVSLVMLRKQQLSKLDELVKSRFVEMFGDPNFTNAFCKKQGNMLFNFSSGKFLEVEKRQENGVPVYGGNGISWYTKEPMIDFPTIIIGRVGAYCGNVKIVKEPVWITDNAIYIKKFKTEDYNIDFLYYLMNYLNFSQYAEVSGQPKITQKPLESTEYIVPPLSLQNQFAAFVEQTEKTKAAIKQSLNRLETLKKALMQEFFG